MASEDYLAHTVNAFHQMLYDLPVDRDTKTQLDDLVKSIQHYTYRVALSVHSVKLAETLQSVYIGCSDPTGSKHYWQFNGEKALSNLKG